MKPLTAAEAVAVVVALGLGVVALTAATGGLAAAVGCAVSGVAALTVHTRRHRAHRKARL